MSETVSRLIRILETCANAEVGGLTMAELIERSDIASSTAYRLVAELEEESLLYRASDRRLHPNFSFERRISDDKVTPEQLFEACEEISSGLQCASEIILLRGHNLLWHITDEHPQQPIRLRAYPGYIRGTYELDSISRLALAHLPIGMIANAWDKSAFFEVGVSARKLVWEEAQAKLLATDLDSMQYDMMGNAKGVRRFCVALTDGEGRLTCLLTVAEAAVPLRDEAAHIARIENTLMRIRNNLRDGATRQTSKMSRPAG